MRTLVFSIVKYGCRSWMIMERDRKRINALEMWAWRKMLGIHWSDRRRNQRVTSGLRSLHQDMQKMQRVYFGRIARRGSDFLEKITMLGYVGVSRSRGWLKGRWTDGIGKMVGTSLQCAHLAQNRRFRKIVIDERTSNSPHGWWPSAIGSWIKGFPSPERIGVINHILHFLNHSFYLPVLPLLLCSFSHFFPLHRWLKFSEICDNISDDLDVLYRCIWQQQQ